MEIQNTTASDFTIQGGMKSALQETRTESVKSGSATAVQKESDDAASKKKEDDLKQELAKLTEDLNKEMNPLNINVRFGFEDKIDEMFVSVYEKDSNKLLRKIPSDEAIALMAKMREIIGIIFDKKA
jgi:flagellar protein FlaG